MNELTTTQLLKEIKKTDKIISDFKESCNKLICHKDKSNSSEFNMLVVDAKEIIENTNY